jgi:hypothetical protein
MKVFKRATTRMNCGAKEERKIIGKEEEAKAGATQNDSGRQ